MAATSSTHAGDPTRDSSRSWLVLACSLSCLFFFSLLTTSLGIVQVEIIDDLKVGSGIVSIMTSVALGSQNLFGPVSGALSSLLSIRCTVFIGTLFMSFGLLMANFSYTLSSMFIFFLIIGIGNGLAFTPCIVVINHHFWNKRMFANSILLCAPGLGSMSLPYLHRFLIDHDGWRYSLAINGALILNALVFASFFTPTATEKKGMVKLSCHRKTLQLSQSLATESDNLEHANSNDNIMCYENEKKKLFSNEASRQNCTSFQFQEMIKHDGVKLSAPYCIISECQEKSSDNSIITTEILSEKRANEKNLLLVSSDARISDDFPLSHELLSKSKCHSSDLDPYCSKSLSQLNRSNIDVGVDKTYFTRSHNTLVWQPPMHEKETKVKDIGSFFVSNLEFAGSEMGSCLMMTNAERSVDQKEEEDIVDQILFVKIKRVVGCHIVQGLCLSCLLYMSGITIHLIHFPSYVVSKGMTTHQVSVFFTVRGVSVVVGRLLGGVIYNRFKPPLLPLFFFLQVLTGLTLGLAPFYATEPMGVCVMEVAFAVFFGHGFMVLAPMVAEIVDIHDLAIAFGIIQLFNGLGFVASPILAGFVRDITGTFDIPMYIAGSFCIAGSIVVLCLIGLTKGGFCKTRRRKKQDQIFTDEEATRQAPQ